MLGIMVALRCCLRAWVWAQSGRFCTSGVDLSLEECPREMLYLSVVYNTEGVVLRLWTTEVGRPFATAQLHDDKRPVRHCPDYLRPPLRAPGSSATRNHGQYDERVSSSGRFPNLVDIGSRSLTHSVTEDMTPFTDSLLLERINFRLHVKCFSLHLNYQAISNNPTGVGPS